MTPYYEHESGTLYHGDCLDIMPILPDGFIDLTVTSPPYDNLRTYENSLEWNFDIFKNIAKELYRITKKGGVIVWVVADATIKGSETGTSFKQALYFKEIGFNLHDTMIYSKSSQPRQNGYRYEQQFEYMFVLSNGPTKIKHPIKEPSKHSGKIVKRTCRDGGKDSLTISTNKVNAEKIKSNIWEYGTKINKSGHPAIFPERLANDHILSWSNENDIVFDLFCGSGTTAIASINTNRKWICIEKEKDYCDTIVDRIEQETQQLKLFATG